MKPTGVVVADSMGIIRSGVSALLSEHGGYEVTEARDSDELQQAVLESPPDIVLLDDEIPPGGALGALDRLVALAAPVPAVIVWSFTPVAREVVAALQAGASGYLDRGISPESLLRSLDAAITGEVAISRSIASLVVEGLHLSAEQEKAQRRAAVLSNRERQVLRLVASGARNREIAESLYISEFTVKRHVQNILQKLGVSSRRSAAAFCDLGPHDRIQVEGHPEPVGAR